MAEWRWMTISGTPSRRAWGQGDLIVILMPALLDDLVVGGRPVRTCREIQLLELTRDGRVATASGFGAAVMSEMGR
jgi:hypothetical protein